MNEADVALFHRAETLSNSGQTQAAHEMFCALQERNPMQVEVLFWIATTSADPAEAAQAIEAIRRLQPLHPRLQELGRFHNRKLRHAAAQPIGPVIACQYCGNRVPARVKWRISVGGWVWFAAWFVVFICFMSILPPAQMQGMGVAGFFCLGVGIVGLFIIRKRTYLCGQCGSKITDAD
jgi:DNA-directed RNA polymerase subunit RPC12/RpoP